MTQEQIKDEMKIMLDEMGLTSPLSIALGLLQKAAEIESKGDPIKEADALRKMLDWVEEEGELEVTILRDTPIAA